MGTCKNPGTCRADCLFTCVPCATTFADLREADRAVADAARAFAAFASGYYGEDVPAEFRSWLLEYRAAYERVREGAARPIVERDRAARASTRELNPAATVHDTAGTRMCHTEGVTRHYLSLQDVADRLGVSRNTVAKLRLPKPDVIVGSSYNAPRGWSIATIDAWDASRPGKGWRKKVSDA